MTDKTQPEALRLVEQYNYDDPATYRNAWKAAVCTELRRQHAHIAELEARVQELGAMARENRSRRIVELEAQLAAVGAGGVQALSAAPVEVADAMADSQYLAGVSAGWNAANADDPNEALRKLHESRAGYLKPICTAARAPADSVLEDAARLDWLALAGPVSICVVIDRPHDGEVEVSTDDVTGYGKTLREAIDDARKQGASHDKT